MMTQGALPKADMKKIIVPDTISAQEIEKIIDFLNEILYDCPINQIYDRIKEQFKSHEVRDFITYYDEIIAAFINTFTAMAKDDYFLSGQNKLLSNPEF